MQRWYKIILQYIYQIYIIIKRQVVFLRLFRDGRRKVEKGEEEEWRKKGYEEVTTNISSFHPFTIYKKRI